MTMYANNKSRTGNRDPKDRYETPPEIVEALLRAEDFCGEILEPAAGSGLIVDCLLEHDYEVTAFDLCEDGIDYLTHNVVYDNMITNPPFLDNGHLKFLQHALKYTRFKIALLLPLTFLTTEKRYDFLKDNPPTRIWVIPNRIRFYRPKKDALKNLNLKLAEAILSCDSQEQDKITLQIDSLKRKKSSVVRIPSQTFNHAWFVWDQRAKQKTLTDSFSRLSFLPPIKETKI